MNSWMNKLERKLGRYAISNISLYLVICYGFGYLIDLINPSFGAYLTLNPYLILHGQVWRLVTWILIPPMSLDLFTILMLFFYYSIGTTLERTWGTFRYNVYLFSGMLFTIVGSFLLMAIMYGIDANAISTYTAAAYFSINGAGRLFLYFSTYYINMSIFLAYAATFPNMQVLLMFIIPVKVKWLGIAYGILLILNVIQGNLASRIVIAASLLNFVVFFLTSRNMTHLNPKQIKRRHDFTKEVKKASPVTRHKCAICGKTEKDGEDLQFRFCSKCEGNYEYCQEHLFTHEHKKSH